MQRKKFVPGLLMVLAGSVSVAAFACGGGDSTPRAPATDAATVPNDAGADATAVSDASAVADGNMPTSDSTSDTGAAVPPADTGGPDSVDGGSAWPPIADYAARGPHAVIRQSNTGPGGGYDIFRPATLGQPGSRHPIISWANGTLFALDQYRMLIEHWASHGFVVVAARTNTTAGGATHKAGIDWLVAENGRAGSVFLGQLDTTKIGAAGHSQGGGATIAAGSNKPGPTGITTTVPLMPILSFENDKTVTDRQLAPMLNINARMDDRDREGLVPKLISEGNNSTTAPLVQATYSGIHEDAMHPDMWKPTLAWFRWQLMGDAAARALFYPAGTCGFCQDPKWMVVYKP